MARLRVGAVRQDLMAGNRRPSDVAQGVEARRDAAGPGPLNIEGRLGADRPVWLRLERSMAPQRRGAERSARQESPDAAERPQGGRELVPLAARPLGRRLA
jgi:hypothetical protein